MKKFYLVILTLFFTCIGFSQIISQYVETNSGTTPKGIEIWNNTAATLDFSTNNLTIWQGTNGATPTSALFTLNSGSLAPGAVLVIGTSDMQTVVVGNGSAFYTQGFAFNGDDSLQVRYGGVVTDIFGTVGTDPGTAWSGSGVSTANQNIELNSGITTGDLDGWSDPSTRFSTVSTTPSTLPDGIAGFGIPPGGVSADTTVQFTSASASAGEGDGLYFLEFSITNESSTVDTTFDVVLTSGDNADINGYSTTTVTYTAGTGGTNYVFVTITDDAVYEGDETLTFEIQNVAGGTNAVVGGISSFDLTIVDNDPADPVALPYSEDFADCGAALWSPFDEQGDDSWTCGSGEYAMNGFGGTDDIDWLISDFRIDFDTYSNVVINVTTQEAYGDAVNDLGEFTLVYSTDYTGGDPTVATWTSLTFEPNNTSTDGTLSTESIYSVDASALTGMAYIAFVYDMTAGSGAENWRILNIDIYEAVNDTDSEVYASTTPIAGGTYIAADHTTDTADIESFAFVIEDLGTSDGEPTIVNNMRFIPGPNNTADWTDMIQGITLYDETLTDYTPTVSINDTDISLTFDTPIIIADGTDLEFVFGFYLNTTNIVDGSIVQFQVDATNSGFVADPAGSDFATTFAGGDFTSNDFEIDVDLFQLTYTEQPSITTVGAVMTPYVVISVVDENGNVDTDFTGSGFNIALTTTGSFDASATTTVEAVNGVATFDNLVFDAAGTGITLLASDETTIIPGTYVSDAFDVIVAPAAGWQITSENTAFVIDFDNTVSGVNEGTFDGSGFSSTPATGQLDSNSWEVTGFSDGDLAFEGTVTSGDYARGVSSGGTSSGGIYSFETTTGNFSLGVQPTGSDFTPGTMTLRAQNQTGNTVTVVDLSYIAYFFNDQGRSTSLNLSYSTDNVTYTDISLLDLASIESADGTPAWSSNDMSTYIIDLSIPDGGYLYIRWTSDDVSGSGSRDEFTLDDIIVVFNPAAIEYTYNGTMWLPEDPEGVSTASDTIIIESGEVTFSTDVNCETLTVQEEGSLTIPTGISLVTTGGVFMESISDNYSSIIVDGSVVGGVSYTRFVNTNANGNDLISPPLTNTQTFEDFALANTNIFSNTANPTEKLFGAFDKVTGTYLTYDTAIPAEAALTLDSGTGYRAAADNSAGFVFTGIVPTTDVTTSITRPTGAPYEAWNLIGNPYPSYLDLGAFYTTNSSQFDPTGGVYGYDGDASDGWLVYNLANSTGVSLAPGQGFFVASQTGGGTVTFTPAMRTTGNSDDFINGRSSENNFGMIKLLATRNQSSYTTEFYFLDNTTLALDQGYDTSVFGGNANGFALYSRLVEDSTNLDMAIQSLPYDSLGSDVMIPLGINLNQGQQVTISIDSMDIPEGIEVYLEDAETNTFTLLNNNEYVFTADSNLSGPGRFYLRFSSEALSIQDNVLDGLSVFASKDIVYIKGQILENTTATLFDIQGRQVISTSLESNSFENTIDVSSISSGVYIVRLQNNNFSSSKKIILE